MPRPRGLCLLGLLTAATLAAAALPAAAVSPVPDPAATARLERWRAAKSGRLQLPLPGTPDTRSAETRLAAAGARLGTPLLIRIFKAESELEVWIRTGAAYTLFATYPVCYWSGTLGPKLREGDRQAPEGFYTITERQLHHGGRWRRSLNVGYPNPFDRVNGRTGSAILIHGGCDSTGCFAMTDPVNAELYDLVSAALGEGRRHVPVHVFPFRMTDAKLAAIPDGPWTEFWRDLKQGYDSFERTRLPPHVSVCGRRYRVRDATMVEPEAEDVALCPEDRHLIPPEPSVQVAAAGGAATAQRAQSPPPCSLSRASCRKWVALRDRRATSRTIAGGSGKRSKVR
jgi:murein L,D-transpeptidase YafK